MIAARVAGVPSPVSFIASDSSLSSRLWPAVCIAVKSVPSVNRFGGRVFFLASFGEFVGNLRPQRGGSVRKR